MTKKHHLSHRILEVWQGFAKVLPNNQALEDYLSTSGCLIGESAWKTHSISRKVTCPMWQRWYEKEVYANIASFLWVFAGWVDYMMADWWTICPGLTQAAARQKKAGWVHYMELNDNQMSLKTFRKQLVLEWWVAKWWLIVSIHPGCSISWYYRGSLNYPFGGIKECKCMVNLKDFPWNSALFGVVSYINHNDLWMYISTWIFLRKSAILLGSKCWHRCIGITIGEAQCVRN